MRSVGGTELGMDLENLVSYASSWRHLREICKRDAKQKIGLLRSTLRGEVGKVIYI